MRIKTILATLASLLLAFSIGCSENKANTPDVKDQASKSLDNAGYKDIKVDVDKDKQLVTLSGDVATQDDKERAEQLSKQTAPGCVCSNEIGSRPATAGCTARKIDSSCHPAIEN